MNSRKNYLVRSMLKSFGIAEDIKWYLTYIYFNSSAINSSINLESISEPSYNSFLKPDETVLSSQGIINSSITSLLITLLTLLLNSANFILF